MKLNKKLLILVLSLVMLVGIFTVSAFAAEDGVLTVKYQDGTVQTYAEGETIVPPAVPAQFVAYDADGKAYLYTTTGTAWEGLPETVTPDLLGTTVEATVAATKGADQIFYSVATGSATAAPVYKTTNNVHQFFTPGNVNTGSVWVKLYADVNVDSFSTGTNSSGYYVYLDLNGHLVSVKTSMKVTYTATFYIYSSKPGAHFYSAASDRMIWTDGNGRYALGDDGSGKYVDNISFHTKIVTNYMWANGGAIIGGHYYQTESALAFVDIGRRMREVKNAKFYLASGTTSVFANDAGFTVAGLENAYITKGDSTITNCEFYSADGATVLYSTGAANVKFSDCGFYGVAPSITGTGSIAQNANAVEGEAVYSTVTFPNGKTEFYVANNVEDAKAYVETHPYCLKGNVAPYFVEDGGKYYYVATPNITLAYDDAFNAIFAETGDRTQVYFTVEKDGAVIQYETDAANYATNFRSYLTAMTAGATVRLWSDITIGACSPAGARIEDKTLAENASYWLDVNGYKLTFTGSASFAMDMMTRIFYIYSSKAGGEIDASEQSSLFRTNNDDYYNSSNVQIKPAAVVCIGESSVTPNVYGKNLTIYCKTLAGALYGTGAYFFGGTVVQVGSTGLLFNPVQRLQATIKYMTFIAAAGSAGIVAPSNNNTFEYCTFVCETPVNAPIVAANCAQNMAFKNCSFVNVVPVYPAGRTMTYENCTFGSTDVLYGANLNSAGAAYLAHGTTAKTVTANGKTYQIDGVIVTDLATVLQITWNDGAVENFAVGAAPYRDYGFVDLANKLIKKNPTYSFSAGVSNGVVIAAGTATATVTSYALEDPFAFTYLDTKTNVIYAVGYNLDCEGTAAGVGDKFYELFNAPASAYVITMYKDMTVNKAMGFGPFVKTSDSSHNRDFYNTAVNGSIVWDLNGTTVTVSADTTGFINPAAANFALSNPGGWNSGNPKTVFCFEGSSATNSVTVKSSIAGGKIVNESAGALFAVGEGTRTPVIFENVTLISEKNYVFFGIELNRDAVSLTAPRLTINGGTYIGGYASGIMRFCGNSVVSDATFVSTNASVAQLIAIGSYRNADVSFDNVVFVAKNATAPAVYSSSSNTHNASFNDCVYIGCEPTSLARCEKLTSLTYTGTNIASSEENLALIYATAPEGKAVANIAYFYTVDGEMYEASLYVYAADAELYTVNYGKVTKSYLVGKYFIPEKITLDICTPIFDTGAGTATLPLHWVGLASEGILDASFGGVSIVAEYDLEGEKQVFDLAFILESLDDGSVLAYTLADSETVGADFAAAVSAAEVENAYFYIYQDITVPAITFNTTSQIQANGHVITVAGTLTANMDVTIYRATLISALQTPFLTADSLLFENSTIYLSGASFVVNGSGHTGLRSTSVYVLGDAIPLIAFGAHGGLVSGNVRLANVTLDSRVAVRGFEATTVLGTAGTFAGCTYDDGVTADIKVNNTVETITVLGETYEVAYAEAASNVAEAFVVVEYLYDAVVRGTDTYLVGSIASFYKEFTTGYYFEYNGVTPLTTVDTQLECTFHADASKLQAQIVLTDALNYVFYLQVEDAGVLANLNINGEAIELASLAQVEIEGVLFYEIPVEFATFADALADYNLAVDLVSGEDYLTITASVALDEYFAAALAAAEDAELVYTVAEYVVALVEYFDYDFAYSDVRMKNLGRINNLLAAYAEYKADLPALPEETDFASDYIVGALLVADEKVTFAFHVADGFDGSLVINGYEVALDKPFEGFDRTYALHEVSFEELNYEISVTVLDADGNEVELLTYTLADYIAGVIAQNEGVAADYAKALWKLAIIAG